MGNIRKALKNDIDNITEMYNDLNDYCNDSCRINYSGWVRDIYPTKDVAVNALNDGSLWVFEVDGKIAGAVILNNNQAPTYKDVNWKYDANDGEVLVVHTLAISPNFTRMGIATEILDFAYELAKKTKMKVIRLDTAEKNVIATKLYIKNLYEDAGLFDLKIHFELPLNRLYRAFEREVIID